MHAEQLRIIKNTISEDAVELCVHSENVRTRYSYLFITVERRFQTMLCRRQKLVAHLSRRLLP